MRHQELIKRYTLFVISMIVSALGIALVTRALLGTSPISSIPLVLSQFTSGTIGLYTLYLNLLLLLLAALLMGWQQEKCHRVEMLLLVPVTVVFAASIDVFMWLLRWYVPVQYVWKVVGLVLGCLTLALGITGEVKANVVMMAGEYFVRAVVNRFHKDFGLVKLCFDVGCVTVAIVLSLVFVGSVSGVREGTVVAALVTGPLTHVMMPLLNLLDPWLSSSSEIEGKSQDVATADAATAPVIVTISRQFGSGGRQLGQAVAEQLGVPFYDREIIDMTALESDMSSEYVERNEQSQSPSDLLSLALRDYEAPLEKSLTRSDRLFVAQCQVIRHLSQQGSCVILGRCADVVLKDYPALVRVYCYTTLADAAHRCVEQYGMSSKGIEQTILSKNRARVAHYQHYTGQRWGDHNNYDLMINTACTGIDTAARLIVDLCRAK